uniref:WGR domain-containing protein n=1 Tax=Haemonchus placei TaxID=6290 RepID=A0A0N4WHW9_HAEPC
MKVQFYQRLFNDDTITVGFRLITDCFRTTNGTRSFGGSCGESAAQAAIKMKKAIARLKANSIKDNAERSTE